MINYLPPKLREYAEFNALCDMDESDRIKASFEQDTNNFYPLAEYVDNEGLERWEKITGITAEGNIKERQFNLKTVINNHAPYTERRIKGMINNLIGEGNHTFNMAGFTLTVKLSLGTKSNLKAVDMLLNNTLPAHIAYEASLQYNTNGDLSTFTHSQLNTYTHQSLAEDII